MTNYQKDVLIWFAELGAITAIASVFLWLIVVVWLDVVIHWAPALVCIVITQLFLRLRYWPKSADYDSEWEESSTGGLYVKLTNKKKDLSTGGLYGRSINKKKDLYRLPSTNYYDKVRKSLRKIKDKGISIQSDGDLTITGTYHNQSDVSKILNEKLKDDYYKSESKPTKPVKPKHTQTSDEKLKQDLMKSLIDV